MLNSAILEVTIGLVFIYCLYSLLATVINEIIASLFKLRARTLEQAIRRMLTDDSIASPLKNKLYDNFFDHGLIKYLKKSDRFSRNASYLSETTFSKAVVDILKKSGTGSESTLTLQVKDGLSALAQTTGKGDESSDTVNLLRSFLQDANGDVEQFRRSLESWFNEMMDRATGWYKRQVQWITFVVGAAIAIGFNVDTFGIVEHLSKDQTAREQLALVATNYVKNHPGGVIDSTMSQRLDSLVVYVDSLYKADINESNEILGLGWDSFTGFLHGMTAKGFCGQLVTALAIMLGAPFWFDVLSKIVQLRGSGPKPKGSSSPGESAGAGPKVS